MSAIFISYRHEDTGALAGRLEDRIGNRFGRDEIFRDTPSIQPGDEFPNRIREALGAATVIVVLIGDRWIGDPQEPRRIDEPHDWVRQEVAFALENDKFIVPVLAERARMPDPTNLPEPLRRLAEFKAIELRDDNFEDAVGTLIKLLTECLEAGMYRKLGTFHVHIDGDDRDHITQLTEALGSNFPSKVGRVTGEPVSGPQRDDPDFEETYRHHTPGSRGNEEFSDFSTTLLGKGSTLSPEAIETLEHIITEVTRTTGPVVELERVVAAIDENGNWTEVELISDPLDLWILADKLGKEDLPRLSTPRLSTFPIEIHHAIDIPKEGSVPPLDLAKDMPKGPNIGGWFLFEKRQTWAYRSNQFADWSDYKHSAMDGDARLRTFVEQLRQKGMKAKQRTLVEQVLGIWRGGGGNRRQDFKSVPDLAHWEMECPDFWVIAANFLGDKSPDTKSAMVENLKRDVTYTYFVRSYADVFRLNMLRSDLGDALRRASGDLPDRPHQIVSSSIRCVLLSCIDKSLEKLLESDYFISPHAIENDHHVVEGYTLLRGAIGGKKMHEIEVKHVIEALSPLLHQKVEGFYLSVPQVPRSRGNYRPDDHAIVCTDLDRSRVEGGDMEWLWLLAEYDRIVAREGSMFQHGAVVRPVRNGYLLVYDSVQDAAEFAQRLMTAVRWHNESHTAKLPHIISLEYGQATCVLRAHGDDYVGSAVVDCMTWLDCCRRKKPDNTESVVAISRVFSSLYKRTFGEEPFSWLPMKAYHGWRMRIEPSIG